MPEFKTLNWSLAKPNEHGWDVCEATLSETTKLVLTQTRNTFFIADILDTTDNSVKFRHRIEITRDAALDMTDFLRTIPEILYNAIETEIQTRQNLQNLLAKLTD